MANYRVYMEYSVYLENNFGHIIDVHVNCQKKVFIDLIRDQVNHYYCDTGSAAFL